MSEPAAELAVMFGADSQHGKIHAGKLVDQSMGTSDVRLLQSGNQDDFQRMHIPVNFQRLRVRPSLANARTILNLITDADLNPIVLGHADRFLKEFKGRVVNPPAAVLNSTREKVGACLAGIDDLIVPRIARFKGKKGPAIAAIDKAGIRFPAILRKTGQHDGRVEGLMTDGDAVLAAIDPTETYYLTEFIDCRADGRGLFHKIRIFYFGDRAVIRHRLISDHWNVHAPDRRRVLAGNAEHIEIERRYVEGGEAALPPRARRVLADIRARMTLDFFGIDFAILPDERLLLFEANATMMFFPIVADPPFAYCAVVHKQGAAAFDAMVAGQGS